MRLDRPWPYLVALATLVLACNGDGGGVQVHNSPPAATITLPPEEAEPFVEGEVIEFEGTALDQGGSDEAGIAGVLGFSLDF